MRMVGKRKRTIRTLGGETSYEREVYECPSCRRTHAPLDVEIGVRLGDKMTRAVVRKVAYAAARASYGQASEDLLELAEIKVSRAEFARVVEEEGARLEGLQREREESYNAPVSREHRAEAPEIRCKRLVLQADATCVLTVKEEEHKSVYCAVAFDAEARGRKETTGRPFITEKRYTASGETMEDFGHRLKALAYRMGMRQAEAMAFIADGARCLWRWAEDSLPRGTVLIQDFWHVCEHLSRLAQDLYGERFEEKLTLWKTKLRESRLEEIVAELRQERKRRRTGVRKRLDEEIKYLQAGRERMDYARFESEGWPIGSGAVEGACKHLVKERFCVTGAHWRRKNIPKLLALRQSIFNGEWNQDWENEKAA